MKAFLLSSARTTALVCASLLLGTISAYGSSSTGGAPGRSDVIKRREKAPVRKSVVPAPELSSPSSASSQSARTRFVWITPAETQPTNTVEREATKKDAIIIIPSPAVNIAPQGETAEIELKYGAVLSVKQKAILQERAEALGIEPGDYARLLTDDEKQRLDVMLLEQRRRVTTAQ